MSDEMLILIGVASVIALLVIMIKGKVHPFLAIGIVSIAIALTSEIPMTEVVPTLIKGMGGTLGSVALIVGLGAMLGKVIDNTLKDNPRIDPQRIYVVGLSRGAEDAMNLLLTRPDFSAGTLLASGREAYTLEWIDGNSTKENLAKIKNIPMWFFHSKEDKVSPVQGSRINVDILRELQTPTYIIPNLPQKKSGDNGITNNNAHNTWDAVFSSPKS